MAEVLQELLDLLLSPGFLIKVGILDGYGRPVSDLLGQGNLILSEFPLCEGGESKNTDRSLLPGDQGEKEITLDPYLP